MTEERTAEQRLTDARRVLDEDNSRDQRRSVAALGSHIPQVRELIEALWKALG